MLVLIQIFYFTFSIPCPNGGPTLSPNILTNVNSFNWIVILLDLMAYMFHMFKDFYSKRVFKSNLA